MIEENNYYDKKNIKIMSTMKDFFILLLWIAIGFLLINAPLFISLPLLFIGIIYIFRKRLEMFKNHNVHLVLDSYGAIQIFDNSMELIALLYKDRTVEYRRECSFWKMCKIKDVSDHFEQYEYELKHKNNSLCL